MSKTMWQHTSNKLQFDPNKHRMVSIYSTSIFSKCAESETSACVWGEGLSAHL